MADELCPPNSVLWPGMLSGDAKWGALYFAEALVLNSHQENFGLAIVEAMACSTPVLISNQVNIWREVESDCAGLVDDDSLQGTIRLLLHWSNLTSQRKAEMRVAAKRCYKNHFSIERGSSELIKVISGLI
jgi:glycosyltransferase involved in cell wall biosynthesis